MPKAWAAAQQVPEWKLAAVMVKTRWSREPARTVTAQEFEAALAAVDGITVSGREKSAEKKGAS